MRLQHLDTSLDEAPLEITTCPAKYRSCLDEEGGILVRRSWTDVRKIAKSVEV